MESRTKTGLLLLMISEILSIVLLIVMFAIWFSFNPANVTTQNYSFIFTMIPAAIIGGIGGFMGFIGAILMILGRNEFGEKHRKFIFYAVVIFIIAIVVMIIFVVFLVFSVFMPIGQTSLTSLDSNSAVNLFRNNSFLTIIPIITPISTVFSGLIWVFGLYQLENRNGRIVLCAAYISMVITSIVVAINSMSVLNNLIGSGVLDKLAQSSSSSYSQLFSNYTWIGSTAIISLVGNSVTYILFVLALFIPYKRIKSGEFVPIRHVSEGTESIRRCPNCGRAIPFDARVCPYCAKRFEEYVST